jgi:hypothetical protein
MRRNIERDTIAAELARHNISWTERPGGKHRHIVLDLPGQPFIPFSYGAKWDGPLVHVVRQHVRRVLRSHIGSLT